MGFTDWLSRALRPAPPPVREEARPRIGIVSAYTTRKGVCTLTRAIESVLKPPAWIFPPRRIRHMDAGFEKEVAAEVEPELRHPLVVLPGTSFQAWLDTRDVVIFVERSLPRVFDYCRGRGIRSVLVALLDYLPAGAGERDEALRHADRVVIHSRQGARLLRDEGRGNVRDIPAGSHWPCTPPPPGNREGVVAYCNIGIGGPQDRRSVPMVLGAFNELLERHREARLVFKMLPEARKYYPDLGPLHSRIRLVESHLSSAEMFELQRSADVTLFPSRFEGLGYPVLESLHAGVPVVATDAPPMNEIVQEGRNGLLVRARPLSTFNLQTVWDPDPVHFRSQLERLLGPGGREEIERLKSGIPAANRERQEAFEAGWAAVIRELTAT